MNAGPEADALYLDQLVELIELIRSSIAGTDQERFVEDRTLGDARALRLGSIGEIARRLSEPLRLRHPEIEWRKMYTLRNIVAHHYHALNYPLLWKVAAEALDRLDAACRDELGRIDG